MAAEQSCFFTRINSPSKAVEAFTQDVSKSESKTEAKI